MSRYNVLFVCTGNICRSPLAEELLRRELEQRGVGDRFTVDSAGTDADHLGQQSDTRMRETARAHGVTINHRARRLYEWFGFSVLGQEAQVIVCEWPSYAACSAAQTQV